MTAWLDTALRMEKRKFEACPVRRDLVPGHEVAQAWGFVVVGYFLVEESLKALLHVQGKQVPAKHSLTALFQSLAEEDRDLLREYYSDFRETAGWTSRFPFKTMDGFLDNLDGDQNRRGTDHVGSFDWRYFLIEEKRSARMPTVSVEFLHEIAYGCIVMVKGVANGDVEPSTCTHSFRLRWKRDRKRRDWLAVRMYSTGGEDEIDHMEVLWGPDYRGRYDLLSFEGGNVRSYFAEIPRNFPLPVVDKRDEFESFDVEEGFRAIGITRNVRGQGGDRGG